MFTFIINNTQNDINWWKYLLDIVSLIMGLCVSSLTLYTAYLRFLCDKIRFWTYSPHFSSFYGDTLSIVIENQSLATKSISEIWIVYDNLYAMQIEKFDEPLILEPFNAKKITSKQITITSPIKFSDLYKYNDIFLMIYTSNKIIYSKFKGKIIKQNKKLNEFQLISKHSENINGSIISNDIKYILYYRGNNNELKCIFIDWAGTMSDCITDFNAIPRGIIENKETVKQFFDKILKPLDIPFTLEERKIL